MKPKNLIFIAITSIFLIACEEANTCKYDKISKTLACVEKTYKTISIDDNIWMAENLTRFHLGGESYCYNDTLKNCYSIGALYPHNIAMEICPKGWTLPSKADFEKVDLKSSEMNPIKAGFRYYDGKYADKNVTASFWTSDIYDDPRAILVRINEKNEVSYEHFNKNIAASVRCIKKATPGIP